jgi:pyruvate dehydrogenase E1 component alpha subunit
MMAKKKAARLQSTSNRKTKRDVRRKAFSGSNKRKESLALLNVESERGTAEQVDLIQFLAPDGRVISRTRLPDISTETLLSAYRTMVLTRCLDERLVTLQRQGRLGTYVSCAGQEASQIGSVMALSERDWIFPMYRDMGMILQIGVPLDSLVNRLLGNSEDESLGRDLPNLFSWKKYRVASFAAPIASHVPLAVGFAMAAKIRNDKIITLTTFGDGATSSGEFHVAMNFAGVYKSPTIFVCENNQYAISVPVNRQTASSSIAVKASAYGFEGVRVDGNDIFAVYSAVKDAADNAKRGGGPRLIECVTYRLQAHSTADDWKRYRPSEEVEKWRERDPLKRVRLYLEKDRRVLSDEKDAALKSEINSLVSAAISKSYSIPPPRASSMLDDVYAEIPWNLSEALREVNEAEKSTMG